MQTDQRDADAARAEAWLEQLDPAATPARDATPLRRIAEARRRLAEAEEELTRSVRDAQAGGFSWAAIGAVLGTSRQAAQQRYGTTTIRRGAAKRKPVARTVTAGKSVRRVAAKQGKSQGARTEASGRSALAARSKAAASKQK